MQLSRFRVRLLLAPEVGTEIAIERTVTVTVDVSHALRRSESVYHPGMDALFDFFNQSWVGSTIGLVGILIGTVLSFLFYRRSRQGAQLAYHYWTSRVLGGKDRKLPEAVTILFKERPIENLCRSLVMIWNNSDKTVYGQNIVKADPLRVDIGEGAQILDAQMVKHTREVNQCTLAEIFPLGESDVPVAFEYLDSSDGCVVEIFHTDSGKAPVLLGSIREMPRGFKNYKRLFPLPGLIKYFMSGCAAIGVAMLCYGIYALNVGDTQNGFGGIFSGALWAVPATALLIRLRRRYPKALSMPELTNRM